MKAASRAINRIDSTMPVSMAPVVTGPPTVTPAIQVGRSSVGSVSSTVPGVRGANAATSPRRSTPMTTAKLNT